MTFEEAKRVYVHRFTMEHVPARARKPHLDRYPAPQYRTDAERFANTEFPPDNPLSKRDCHSSNPSWPLGQWLDAPFTQGCK
jgi:hypothetical protein